MSWSTVRAECVEVLFAAFAPPAPSGTRRVGVESEYVVTAADGTMARPEAVTALWTELAGLGWELLHDPDRGTVTGARRERRPGGAPADADLVTTDYGYATLELNVAPERSLHDLGRQLAALLDTVTGILGRHGAVLLGYGVQPVTGPAAGQLGPGSRYPLLAAARIEELRGRDLTGDLLCLSASSQAQVDVHRDEAVGVLNALTATAGVRAALLANSSVWAGRVSPHLATRELFWDRWWPGRSTQTGVPPRFHDAEHYVDTLTDYRALLISRPGRTWLLADRPRFGDLLLAPHPVRVRDVDGVEGRLRGVPADLLSHFGIGWTSARLHPRHGTVEDRVACQQPPEAPLAAAALTLGLVERSADLSSLVDRMPWQRWRALRAAACADGLRARLPDVDVPGVVADLLAIAVDGLRDRRLGEEVYLEPLAERLEAGRTPADEAVELFRSGGAPALVRRYDMRASVEPHTTRPALTTDRSGGA